MRIVFRSCKGRILIVSLLAVVGIWLLFLANSIIRFGEANSSRKANAIVVLGAAVNGKKPSPVFEERIRHSVTLFQQGMAPVLLFTGGRSDGDHLAESEAARDFAIALGVPASAILIETRSHTTQQNLSEASLLLSGPEKKNSIIIVSDPLHMKRAAGMANDLGFTVFSSPTPTTRYRTWSTKLPFLLRELYFYHHYLVTGN